MCLWLAGATEVAAQLEGAGNSPAENVANRAARSPGRLVQQGIARHQFGPEITRIGTPDIPVRQLVLAELITNLLAQINSFIGLIPTFLADQPATPGPTPGGGGGVAVGGVDDVVMTEVAHDGNVVFVELLSRSPIQIRLQGWHFSDGSSVSPSLPVIELDPNASIVVQLGSETQSPLADLLLGFRVLDITSGELALYNFAGVSEGLLPIEDAGFMVDYIQWNNDPTTNRNPPLESVAAAANLWTPVDAIPSSLANMSFRLAADAEGRTTTASRDFIIVEFSQNTLGVPESQ